MEKWKLGHSFQDYRLKKKSLFNARTRTLFLTFIVVLVVGVFAFVPGITGYATASENAHTPVLIGPLFFIWLFVLLFILVVLFFHRKKEYHYKG